MEHELWFTALVNKSLGGIVAPLLVRLGFPLADPAQPIPNYVAMEILVILLILAGAALLRRRLSVESPGRFQRAMEVVVEFVQSLTDEIIGHDGRRYVAMIGTLGLFIVLCNLLGLLPTFETPTAHIQVTLGLALSVFFYYNFQGVSRHGLAGYLKRLCGPPISRVFLFQLLMAILMLPIEVVGNVGRLLSLSVRLYANMMVGDLLEQVFGGLIPIFVPTVFMALHVFVSLLQAYVFMLLPCVYISMAVAEEH